MEALIIEGKDDTPYVLLDKTNNKFEFSGKSLPEDVVEFYKPILNWLDAFTESPNDSCEIVFKMDYFNTASSKLFLDIFEKFEAIKEKGSDIRIKWYYLEDDEDMEEAGEGYGDLVDIEVDLIPYQ